MNKIKTIIIGLILCTMFFSFNGTVAHYDVEACNIWAIPTSTSISWGDTVYVDIKANIDTDVNAWMIEYINYTTGTINATNVAIGYFFVDNGTSATDIGTINNATGVIGGSLVDYTYEAAAGGTYQSLTNRTLTNITFIGTGIGTGWVDYETPDDTGRILLWAGGGVVSTDHNCSIDVYPYQATGFSATTFNKTKINLAWSSYYPARGIDKIVVFRNASGTANYPTFSNGDEIYNGTGVSYGDTGLDNETKYWYTVYSWNNTAGWYSLITGQDDATTQGDNNPLVFSNPNPSNKTTGVSVSLASWSIAINDPEGDTFNYSIYCSNGNAQWQNNVINGTKTLTLGNGLGYYTNYTVWVNGTDLLSGQSTNETFWFFTEANQPPNVPDNPDPANSAPNIPINTGVFSVGVSDPEGDSMNVAFYWGTNHTLIGTDVGVASGGTASISKPSWLALSTLYYWYANATDPGGSGSTTKGPAVGNWSFTTRGSSSPNQPSTISPANQSTDISRTIGSLTVNVSSPTGYDDLTFNVTFYWCDNDTLIGYDSGVTNNSDASVTIGTLNYSESYSWYVNITDSEGQVTRAPAAGCYIFTTEDEDGNGGGGGGGGGGTTPDDDEEPTVPTREGISWAIIAVIILSIAVFVLFLDWYYGWFGLIPAGYRRKKKK